MGEKNKIFYMWNNNGGTLYADITYYQFIINQ